MRKLLTIFIGLLFCAGSSWAQTNVFTQNFDGAWTIPSTLSPVWSGTTTTSLSWHKNNYTTGWPNGNAGSYSPAGAVSSSGSARFNTYGIGSGTTSDFITPVINLSTYTSGTNYLEFYHINPSGTDNLKVYLSSNGGATWGSALITCGVSSSWALHTAIVLGTTSATVKLKFTGTSDYGYDDIGLDQVRVYNFSTDPQLIVTPSSLAFGNVILGTTSATQSYILSGTYLTAGTIVVSAPADFMISLSAAGPFTSSVNVSYSPPTLANTIYTQFTPTALNATYNGNITNVGGGASVNVTVTGNSNLVYCASAAYYSGYEDITRVQFGSALNNSTPCASLAGSQGIATGTADLYSDFTGIAATTVQRAVTTPITIEITECAGVAHAHTVAVFIDFNMNGSFADPGEGFVIWQYASSNTHTISATILIPEDASLGNTRMRVICADQFNIYPCLMSSYGETEDYTIQVAEAPDCIPPSLLTATGITGYQATLGWAQTGTASSWDIEWGPASFVPTGVPNIPGATNPQVLTGLSPLTQYT
ncbi:MAG: GEVED domain-containing protein [Bacteroidetes bacterium]|nr:GEVED domain-containing protein [Bacteroidota bacterium]